jgi:hypothetical protein
MDQWGLVNSGDFARLKAGRRTIKKITATPPNLQETTIRQFTSLFAAKPRKLTPSHGV